MRVALYARVSTESQQARGTIGSQLAVLRERVGAEGDEVVAEFCDDGHSGARLDRPGLDALRDAAEAGLIERVWCLSPDRLARVYAYQVIVLDELARHGVERAVHRRPTARRRPAGQAAHPGPGRDRRVRAGEDRRTVPAREAVPLPRRGGAGLAHPLRLPPPAPRRARPGPAGGVRTRGRGRAADLRRLRPRRALAARDHPPAGRRPGPAPGRPRPAVAHLHAEQAAAQRGLRRAGLLQPHRSGPRPAPRAGAASRSPAPARTGSPSRCPPSSTSQTFEAAGRVSRDNSQWSPRRAEPGQWLLRGLVKCGVCGVGTNCHKMRGRNGTWNRYYYCRNHDPIKAGGDDRRCPERNIRSDALDTFVFDQVRAALLRPDVLTAGEQALAVRTPTPDDELLAAELARLDRKLDATDAERRRLVDLYQAGLIELPELQRRAADVEHRRRDLEQRRDALTAQRQRAHPRQPAAPPRPRLRHPRPRRDRHPRLRPETDPAPPRRRRGPRHRLARPDPAPDPARRQPRRPAPTAEPRPRSRPARPGVNRRPSAFTW